MGIWTSTLKPFLKRLGVHNIWNSLKRKLEAKNLSGQSREDIFTNIYKNNSWKGKESVSGAGSDLHETGELLKQLPELLKRHKIKTIIDLPCGDFNWMKHLEYNFDHYTGIDIVEEIVMANNRKYGNDTRVFKKKDCLNDDIGSADLLMCRDLLIHFSEADIFRFFQNLQKTNITYILTTHFFEEKNQDIATGQWRPINLTEQPYNLPKPADHILEKTKMFDGRFSQTKTMSLWRIEDIRSILKKAA